MTRISPPRPRRLLRRRSRSRGQAVVEFALILPVFLLFTLGVVDMARVFTSYIALTNGVANAALYAGQGSNYLHWCGASSAVPCPAGAPLSLPQRNPDPTDPSNIAYQISVESVGLTASGIHMSTPACYLNSNGFVEACSNTAPKAYSRVQIGASYDMTLFTPLMTQLMGGPIHMGAQTTAAVLQ